MDDSSCCAASEWEFPLASSLRDCCKGSRLLHLWLDWPCFLPWQRAGGWLLFSKRVIFSSRLSLHPVRWNIPEITSCAVFLATSSISLDFCKSWSIISIHSSEQFHSGEEKMSSLAFFWVFHFMSFQKLPSISVFLWQLGIIQSFFASN